MWNFLLLEIKLLIYLLTTVREFIYGTLTAWKMSVFGVFLVRVLPHLEWIRIRKTPNMGTFPVMLVTKNSLKNNSIEKIKHWFRQKDDFVVRKVFEMGVTSTILIFNDGSKWFLHVMKELKVVPGSFSGFFSNNKDSFCVCIVKSKSNLEAKSKSRRLPTDRKILLW